MIADLMQKQKQWFSTGVTKSIPFRLNQLKRLRESIQDHEKEILEALKLDLNKPEFEAYATEVGFVLDSIRHFEKNLEKWAKDKTTKTPIHQAFSKGTIKYEPYGTVLIIAPYNYPFQLLIEPLIGAISAGNTVILKPSEYTTHTEKIIIKVIEDAFDPEYICVVTGGRDITQELIHAPFDYIFFTGSVEVGKVVMRAAADHLVPVTLELGGKSPTIVHEDADIVAAAERITWGKFMNAGQICIAPDYIYVHASKEQLFIDEVLKNIVKYYGTFPIKSPDYCRIVNQRHMERLIGLINHDKVVMGGQYDMAERYIAPTVMKGVTWDDAVMKEEIFGPLMPIMTYTSLEDVIQNIIKRPKPLALYLFSESESIQDYVMDQVSFGGGCINDTILHVSSPYLPFGGVGASGMGAYHGEDSFKTFSHAKSILKKTVKVEKMVLYPPYKNNVKWIKKLLK